MLKYKIKLGQVNFYYNLFINKKIVDEKILLSDDNFIVSYLNNRVFKDIKISTDGKNYLLQYDVDKDIIEKKTNIMDIIDSLDIIRVNEEGKMEFPYFDFITKNIKQINIDEYIIKKKIKDYFDKTEIIGDKLSFDEFLWRVCYSCITII